MVPPLERAIRSAYDRLPAGERKLADVVLELRGALASYSATELAESAGVSKATASRLVRRLGFADFQEMRQQARDSAANGSPLAEIPSARPGFGALEQHLANDAACLYDAFERISADETQRAAQILSQGQRVWVAGFRNSFALALYARSLLTQIKPDVRLLPAPGQTLADELTALTDKDAALIIGFRRRPQGFAVTLSAVAEAGARIVLIGDPSLGDLDRRAEATFRCQCRGSGPFDSYVAPISLINYLCAATALSLGEAAAQQLRRSEQWHEKFRDLRG